MIRTIHTLALLTLTTLLLTGCGGESPAPEEAADTTAEEVSPEDVQQSIKDASITTGKYVEQSTERAIEASQQKIKELEAEFEELGTLAAEKGEEAREKFDAFQSEFQDQVTEATEKLNTLKEQGGAAAGELTEGVSAAVDEIQKSVERAKAELTKETQEVADAPGGEAEDAGTEAEAPAPAASSDEPAK